MNRPGSQLRNLSAQERLSENCQRHNRKTRTSPNPPRLPRIRPARSGMYPVSVGMTVSRAAAPFGEAEHFEVFLQAGPGKYYRSYPWSSVWLDYLVCKFSVGIAQSSGIAVSRVTGCRS